MRAAMEAIQAQVRRAAPLTAGARLRPPSERRLFPKLLVAVWVAVAAATVMYGLEYYLTPLVERPFLPQHELLKPAGLIGQAYGVIGTLFIFLGVASYALRKRVVRTNRVGKLKYWLESHIFLCTLGPFLILLHTTFRFGGLVSIAFWSMVIVVLSGVFGRYVFIRIPKTINGRFRTLQDVRQEQDELLEALESDFGVSSDRVAAVLGPGPANAGRDGGPGLVGAFLFALRSDLRRRARSRQVRSLLADAGVPTAFRGSAASLIRKQVQLEQQMALLRPFQRLFRYWHLLHLPLSMVMAAIVVLHIAVAILFGYTWLF